MKHSKTHTSLERGLKILEIVAENGPQLTLAEISKKSFFSRSTTYHILKALVELGYLVKDEKTLTYGISSKFFRLTKQKWSKEHLADISKSYLEKLSKLTGEGSSLAVLHNGTVFIVAKRDHDGPVRVVQEIGATRPIYCTAVGKALAAWLSEEELERIIKNLSFEKMTPNTVTSPEEFRKELSRIRTTGIAFDDEEHIEGIRCIAVPVRDHFGEVCASLCIVGPKHRLTKNRLRGISRHLFSVASELSSRLGFEGYQKGGEKICWNS